MKTRIRHFRQLTADELYEILKLRVDVFVVEQNCPYRELDGLDRDAFHLWLEDREGVRAYLRIMDRGVESDCVSIGRVVAAQRGCGLGGLVLKEGIRAAREIFGPGDIYLEAQTYARGFYEKYGFRQCSDEFILDGIAHIGMRLTQPERKERRINGSETDPVDRDPML